MADNKNQLPQGWAKTTLGEILEFNYGKSLHASKRDNVGYAVYGSNGIIGNHSVPLTKGTTLIVGRKGSIGETHLSIDKCWPIDTTYFIEDFHGQPPLFWLHLLRTLRLAELDRATALPGLNRNDVYRMSVDLPPQNEQKRIVARIEKLQARSRRAREALETIPDLLEQLRQSVLSAAFRGELTKKWREKRNLPAPKPGCYFVYVLKCADGSNYIGITEDLERRWEEHRSGKGSQWTQKNFPQYVLHWEEHDTRQSAAKREKWLKTGFGRKWIRREEKAGRLRQAGNMEPAAELLKRIRTERRKRWEAAELDKLKAKGLTGEQLDAQFAKRRKQYQEPVSVDASDLPELPEEWCWATIGEISEIVTKGSSPNWQGFDYVSSGIPFVRSQNVLSGELDLSELAFLPAAFNEKERKSVLVANDVLTNIVGASIGRAALATMDVAGGNVNQAVAVIRLIPFGLIPNLLVEWLLSPNGQRQIHGGKVDVARANLSLADVSGIAVPLSPNIEQEKLMLSIHSAVSFIRSLSDKLIELRKRITALDQTILSKAFHGELVPQDPNDEPASILIERIRQEKARQTERQKAEPKRRGRKMKKSKAKQQEILTILQQKARAMTPEELFAAAGFDEDSVDEFYDQLRAAVTAKAVREKRKGPKVYMEAIK